jgi:flavin reductase (DIM6/NTAB) family NADH-FMN oxidoreductase RutF
MTTYNPKDIPHKDFHQILLSAVSPRPIAFVTSMNKGGQANLSPFSFFNAFASKPPVVAIGPAIAAATGREKDTLLNILETGECTISTVHFDILHQMNLASTNYDRGVDEYLKAGLTKKPSEIVKPPYVAESHIALECALIENIELFREEGGNGNIMLLRVLRLHAKDDVLTEGKIDPRKMDLVGRMGYKWYTRVSAVSCFECAQPIAKGIGFDNLPIHVLNSTVLRGSDLAKLASVTSIPEQRKDFAIDEKYSSIPSAHDIAQQYLDEGMIEQAWQVLLKSSC